MAAPPEKKQKRTRAEKPEGFSYAEPSTGKPRERPQQQQEPVVIAFAPMQRQTELAATFPYDTVGDPPTPGFTLANNNLIRLKLTHPPQQQAPGGILPSVPTPFTLEEKTTFLQCMPPGWSLQFNLASL